MLERISLVIISLIMTSVSYSQIIINDKVVLDLRRSVIFDLNCQDLIIRSGGTVISTISTLQEIRSINIENGGLLHSTDGIINGVGNWANNGEAIGVEIIIFTNKCGITPSVTGTGDTDSDGTPDNAESCMDIPTGETIYAFLDPNRVCKDGKFPQLRPVPINFWSLLIILFTLFIIARRKGKNL